jgi:hypothetical protein
LAFGVERKKKKRIAIEIFFYALTIEIDLAILL